MAKYILNPLEAAAIKIQPRDNWYPWIFRSFVGGVMCTGAICPLKTKGPNKGQPNFRKADKLTKTNVFVADGIITDKDWEEYNKKTLV